jgi:ssRNA-specific RNase YbeY (16S rRNA maturation enzyme)
MIAIIITTLIAPEINAKPTNKKEKKPRPPHWQGKQPDKSSKNNPKHNSSSPPGESPTYPSLNNSVPTQNITDENPGNPQIYPHTIQNTFIFFDWQYMVGDWQRQPNEHVIIYLNEVKSNNSDYNLSVIVINSVNETTFNFTFHVKPSKTNLELYLGALRFSEGNNTVVATVGDIMIYIQTIERTGFESNIVNHSFHSTWLHKRYSPR